MLGIYLVIGIYKNGYQSLLLIAKKTLLNREMVDILDHIKTIFKMSKSNIFTSVRKVNKDLYDYAVQNSKWICYKKKWYTPTRFITSQGTYDINPTHVKFENPKELLRQGREILKNMIINDKPKDQILEALERLNAFSDRVRIEHPVHAAEYDL